MDLQSNPKADVSVPIPASISLEEFVDGIEAISRGVISKQILRDYLVAFQIAPGDLESIKSWSPEHHTRNLIFRNPRIEVMAICWSVGNATPVHTHNGQLGWMFMVEGKLRVENFRLRSCNRPENQEVVGMDCLAGATQIEMQPLSIEICTRGGPLNTVDKHQTIHRISNLVEWNEPAVSLHVYSLPIDSCVVFDLQAQRCFRRDLSYDTVAPGAIRG